MKIIGIIPARAGSKRIPDKNLIALDGRPLLSYTCDAAIRCGIFETVVINTDCRRIAAVAAEHGVQAPALRPAHLATDDAPTRAANIFVLEHLAALGHRFDAVCVLQPTSPLRSTHDIRAAVELWKKAPDSAVVSVSPVAPSTWCGTRGPDGGFVPLADVGALYRLNGALYVYSYENYLQSREPKTTRSYVMPAERGVDIDTWEDLEYAEHLLRKAVVAHAVVDD